MRTILFCVMALPALLRAQATNDSYSTGDGDLLKVENRQRLMLSTDKGQTWTKVFEALRIWRYSARAPGKIWVGYRCGAESACVSFSDDKGNSWQKLPYDYAYALNFLFSAPNGKDVITDQDSGSNDGNFWISNDGGKNFNSAAFPPTTTDDFHRQDKSKFCAVGEKYYGVFDKTVIVSMNHGQSWQVDSTLQDAPAGAICDKQGLSSF